MKRILLSAVLLSSIGLNAQSEAPAVKTEKAVGIETTTPRATLDVNGDARLQKVELMTTSTPTEKIFSDCPCVLTIDEYGVIHRIPKGQFVLVGDNNSGETTYTSVKEKTYSESFTRDNCPAGTIAGSYEVSKTESAKVVSKISQEDADVKAEEAALKKATDWVKDHGQAEANTHAACNQQTYSATKTVDISRNWTDNSCPNGKVGEEQTITGHGEGSATSDISQADADEKALTIANQKANESIDQQIEAKENDNSTCKWKESDGKIAVCNAVTKSYVGMTANNPAYGYFYDRNRIKRHPAGNKDYKKYANLLCGPDRIGATGIRKKIGTLIYIDSPDAFGNRTEFIGKIGHCRPANENEYHYAFWKVDDSLKPCSQLN